MTPFTKKKDIKNDWYLINAENVVVGRLAAYISLVLRGKNKPKFNNHIDNGDFVIVNVDKIKFTGKKETNKNYYKHTNHPGGLKITTPQKISEKIKGRLVKISSKKNVARWSLAKKQLTKLKVYYGDKHPHEMQKPKL